MRQLKKTFFLLAVAVSLVVVGASRASAQTVLFDTTTTPTDVITTGFNQVLGQVTLAAPAACSPGGILTEPDGFCVSTAGTIVVLFQGVQIDLNAGPLAAITITDTNGAYFDAGTGISVANTPAGGTVSIPVLGAVDIAAGQLLSLSGVRGDIASSFASVAGSNVNAQLTASPSTIASFSPTSEVVARSRDAVEITIAAATILQCIGTGNPTITVDELFPSAFVDHADALDVTTIAGATINQRPLFGAGNNTYVTITVTDLPAGLTLGWPTLSDPDSSSSATGAVLQLITTGTGTSETYLFSTPDQALSDVATESFLIGGGTGGVITVGLTGDGTDFGPSTADGTLAPGPDQDDGVPSFTVDNLPSPADPFITVGPCTTSLLYTFTVGATPDSSGVVTGFNTGLAIANTTVDPFGTFGATAQSGTCVLNGFPQATPANTGATPPAPVAMTTSNIVAGDTWSATLSNLPVFQGFIGYIIAVCNFQFAHGYAFITDTGGLAGPNVLAQGYLALLIPDPVVVPGGRVPQDAALSPIVAGEGLSN